MFGSTHIYLFNADKPIKILDWKRDVIGKEKPELLGWKPHRVIKTIFLQDRDSQIYGVVLPLDKRVETKGLAEILEIPRKKATRLHFAESLPYLHKPHATAPFICDQDRALVAKIVFSDYLFEEDVDFSYPGRIDLSLHMKYQDAIDILLQRYPTIIKIGKVC
ncbi:YbaK/EbsC family protein [Candidatus Woesearchaeota archaeon]|nr:YbaK/EbsC family protein [Candidatus Woesearchaeota archaeon]